MSIHVEAWQCVEEALGTEHAPCVPANLIPGPHRRLFDALADRTAGSSDIVVLVRHVLGWEDVRRGGEFGLRVSSQQRRIPHEDLWRMASVSCIHLADGRIYLQRERWVPPGDHSAGVRGDPLHEVYLEGDSSLRQHFDPVPADPFWTAILGYHDYHSAAQRQAALSIVTAPPGATLLLNLPTGTGKTSLAFAPALLASQHVGVSIIVVPTVVLALDQERRLREFIADQGHRPSPAGRYAYIGEMAEEEKAAMRDAVRAGEQRVLFTSPEALMTGLVPALHVAAQAGHLRYFVIDEAHIIDQWGVDFRPEFQSMTGLRRSLVEESAEDVKPVTVLMTGTLNVSTADTLRRLFAGDWPFRLVSGSALRCEPEYFVSRWASLGERRGALREHLLCLPRPAIVYVSLPEQVDRIRAAMSGWGFHRHVGVSGRSTARARREVVEGWRADAGPARYDVVVATSAFGLGVDMPNVRSVIHACQPETIDRFYQEVGRGGRDGNPSVSCLLLTEADRDIAEHLGSPTMLRAGKAEDRWSSMLSSAQMLQSTRLLVDLDTAPPNVTRKGPTNRRWNVYLLSALARTGVLELSARNGAEMQEEVSAEQAVDCHYIEVIRHREVNWADYKAERDRIAIARRKGMSELALLESGRQCVGEVLHRWYSFRQPWGDSWVPRSCRGCAYCRRAGRPPIQGLVPMPWVVDWGLGDSTLSERVRDLMPMGRLTVLIDGDDMAERMRLARQVLDRLIVAGFSHVLDVGSAIMQGECARLQRSAGPRPVIRSMTAPDPLQPKIPTVALLPQDHIEPSPNIAEWFDMFPAFVVVAPSNLHAPGRPQVAWSDLYPPCVTHVRLLEDL